MKLVIVESPTKAKTLSKFLGDGYEVLSSMGHVVDLPKKELGIDIEHDFAPKYEDLPKKKATIAELKKAAKGAAEIFLATDPDREGEAIAWHLGQIVGDGKTKRVSFHEITEEARAAAKRLMGGSSYTFKKKASLQVTLLSLIQINLYVYLLA